MPAKIGMVTGQSITSLKYLNTPILRNVSGEAGLLPSNIRSTFQY